MAFDGVRISIRDGLPKNCRFCLAAAGSRVVQGRRTRWSRSRWCWSYSRVRPSHTLRRLWFSVNEPHSLNILPFFQSFPNSAVVPIGSALLERAGTKALVAVEEDAKADPTTTSRVLRTVDSDSGSDNPNAVRLDTGAVTQNCAGDDPFPLSYTRTPLVFSR